jgi:hypothetical protein
VGAQAGGASEALDLAGVHILDLVVGEATAQLVGHLVRLVIVELGAHEPAEPPTIAGVIIAPSLIGLVRFGRYAYAHPHRVLNVQEAGGTRGISNGRGLPRGEGSRDRQRGAYGL